MKSRIVLACVLLLLGLVASAQASSGIDNQLAATCRITAGNGMGTGCCYLIDGNYAAILTAAHVVNQVGEVVACEFWLNGHKSAKLRGQVYVRDTLIDAAAVLIPVPAFGGHIPPAIPLGQSRDAPRPGDTICSVGCANGSWETAWKGCVTRYDSEGRFFFVPPPANGRSGSVITDATASKIVGLLQVRADQEGGATGIAVLNARIRHAMTSASKTFLPAAEIMVACGPGGCCPNGGCDQGSGLLIRRPPPQQSEPQGNPWPNMQPPFSPPVDLSPILGTLQSIEGKINATPPPTANPLDSRVDSLLPRVDKLEQGIGNIGKDVGEVKQILGPLVKLHDKLEADEAAGGIKGKMSGQILKVTGTEVGASASGSEDPAAKIHKEIFIVLGVLATCGIIAFCVLHLLKDGKGPVGDLVDKLAKAHPDDVKLQAMAAKVDAFDTKLQTTLAGVAGGPAGAAAATVNGLAPQLQAFLAGLNLPSPNQGVVVPPTTAAAPVSPTTVNVHTTPAASVATAS
jgi:hypothetical protein